MYQHLQELVLRACNGEAYQDHLETVLDVFKNDLSRLQFEAQLPLMKQLICKEFADTFSVYDVVHVLSRLSVSERTAFFGVCNSEAAIGAICQNVTSERLFSTLSRVKTYPCITMFQQRLNNLVILCIYKNHFYRLELEKAAHEFVSGREGKQKVFGSFS